MKKIDEGRVARLLHHRDEGLLPGDSVVPPIVPAAVFHLPGEPSSAPYQYGRFHNPTWEALEAALSVLEEAETIVLSSGLAAIAAVLFACARSGDRILLPADGYHATRALAEQFLKPLGVSVELRPTACFLEGGFEGLRLVLAETPSNPGLDVCDIAAVAEAAKRAGAIFGVDNTTMTPLGQRPLELGADLVVCADTKAINGHSDTLMGHIATRDKELMTRLRAYRKLSGAIPGPFEAWLVHRGLETLEVRFTRMCSTALVIAEQLSQHPKIVSVRHPGLKGDPSRTIASRQMATFGFMISVTFKDGVAAERFINDCPLVQASTSFGGVRTSAERRARWGDAVPDGFVRLSIGLEPVEPLWQAIERALSNLG